MRYSKEHKEQTHRRIVEAASHGFREQGIDGIGLSRLMKQLGLTHGGFYEHFPNKEALVAEACACAFEESSQWLESVASEPSSKDINQVLDNYLSQQHRDQPGDGCILPALASDLFRQPDSVRQVFTDGIKRYQAILAQLLEDKSESPQAQAIALLSAMVGCITLARAVNDPTFSNEILEASRSLFSQLLESEDD
jgi:TetR/AcrR family transcriptional repressor of nem operon